MNKLSLFTLMISLSITAFSQRDTLYLMSYELVDTASNSVNGNKLYTKFTYKYRRDEDSITLIFRNFQASISKNFCGFELGKKYTFSLIKERDSTHVKEVINSEYFQAFHYLNIQNPKFKRGRKRSIFIPSNYVEVNTDYNFYSIIFIKPCNDDSFKQW